MCGIVGQVSFRTRIDEKRFLEMRDSLVHRGPDDAGCFFSDDGSVALGHRRLSFLDLSESGRQPMPNEDESLWLTFNGEIYNYQELRERLVGAGHRFRSGTDSEVILHGYEQWGFGLLGRLVGMFAFGVWDAQRRRLWLARDRFGIKPLYYYHDGANFIFGSELKAIRASRDAKRSLDPAAVGDYLVYKYVPSPGCIWHDTHKLPPAHHLVLEQDGSIRTMPYWQLEAGRERPSEADAIRRVDELLEDSVRYHVRADVPLGVLLSGGYDSSAVVQYLHRIGYPIRSFSLGFQGWDESEHRYAELVAETFGGEHRNAMAGNDSFDLVDRLLHFFDEPLSDISIIPTYMVSGLAAQHVKAVLSGDGGDETFVGYQWHLHYMQAPQNPLSHYRNWMEAGRFDGPELRAVLHPDLHGAIREDPFWFYGEHLKSDWDGMKALQYLDYKCFLAEMVLPKVDRASMAHSLEVRVPFLDHRLVEYVFSLDLSLTCRPGFKKFLLFKQLEREMPEPILRRDKRGFVGPASYYQAWERYARELLDGCLVGERIVNRGQLEIYLGEKDHSRLWKLFVLEFWYRHWMK